MLVLFLSSMFLASVTISDSCTLYLQCLKEQPLFVQEHDDLNTHFFNVPIFAFLSTAPCPPKDVKESVNCDNGTISITWSAVPGAVTYTATLEELTGGTPSCCSTSGNGCNITDLPCGEMYILHVIAEGRTCNSSESEGHITRTGKTHTGHDTCSHTLPLWSNEKNWKQSLNIFRISEINTIEIHFVSLLVACVPENLKASLSCSNNVASMSWGYSKGGQLYSVRAVSTDGHVHECRSPDNECDLTDLHCGEHYTTTVTAEDIQCKSKPSDSVTIKTGMFQTAEFRMNSIDQKDHLTPVSLRAGFSWVKYHFEISNENNKWEDPLFVSKHIEFVPGISNVLFKQRMTSDNREFKK